MTLLELILYVVIAAVCGALARAVAGGTAGGFLVSFVVGFVGAFVGSWLARQLHLPWVFVVSIGGERFPIVWSVVGGIVLVALANLFTRPRHVDHYAQ
jgi:uncharacterized membrane protein YeaQ/YmgE (transglycosylase-associated protein family)